MAHQPNKRTALELFGIGEAELLERIDEGFYVVNSDWILLCVNPAAARFWKKSEADLVGRSMLELFPKFHGSESYLAHARVLETGVAERLETISTASQNWVQLKLYAKPPFLSVLFSDIAPRVSLEASLRTKDETLTLAEASVGIGVWDADLTTQTVQGTPQFFRLHGLEPQAGPVPMEFTRSVRHEADRERMRLAFLSALESKAETHESEYRIVRPDGKTRWIFGRGRISRDRSGKAVRYTGIDLDVTDRKRQEEQLHILTSELQHRTNNLLAVVQSIARQSLQTSDSIADFQERFDDRLSGLAESMKLLVARDWKGLSLEDLVASQMKPFGPSEGRLRVTGPPVTLTPKAAETLGMVFHELATNAAKYGAWSADAGVITVAWVWRDQDVLEVRWTESDGPAVVTPDRKGFGRFVTETLVANALKGSVSVEFNPAGLQWMCTLRSEFASRDS